MRDAPTAYGQSIRSTQPRVTTSPKGCRVVQDHELITGSVGADASTLDIQNYPINPGMEISFPWLCNTAINWEQYRIHRLEYFYVPFCGTQTVGMVTLAPEYDASEPPPVSEAQLNNNFGAVSGPVWKPMSLRMNAQALMGLGPRKFIRGTAMAGDIKTFDAGILRLGVNNLTSTALVGKLYVSYDIEFFMPQSGPSTVFFAKQASMFSLETPPVIPNGAPFEIAFDRVIFDGLSLLTQTIPASGHYRPPAGCYLVTAEVSIYCTTNGACDYIFQLLLGGGNLVGQNGLSYVCDSRVRSAAASQQRCQACLTAICAFNGLDSMTVVVTPSTPGNSAIDLGNARLLFQLI